MRERKDATMIGYRSCTLLGAIVLLAAGMLPAPGLLGDDGAGDRVQRDRPPQRRRFPPARNAWQPGRRPGRIRGEKGFVDPGGRYHAWLQEWGKKHPDEYEELMRLKKEDPDEFRRRFVELARKHMQERWRARRPPEERRCLELSEQYHKAKSPEEKERILAELRKAVEAAFDARIKERLRRVEQMEQQLKQIRQRIQERQANKDKIVEARIEELTRDPKYRWDW